MEEGLKVRAGAMILVVLFDLLFLKNIIISIHVGSERVHKWAQV